MTLPVNMLEAKTNLSKLVQQVESGAETEVIIARGGRPVARLVPLQEPRQSGKRLGLLEGRFPDLDLALFNGDDQEIASLFLGRDQS
ncbi:type II toxin-antitoxin system Phd/YefM family antitoxin [Oryzibacter oryziterrae]|uniref:type II toxin-antitoxin system Phd/YefM family antitoxin n=1 Tax=Oryzibacter oryziterrae TaxID=2766474 RepID=UPI001F02806E|nr:type II toxin-antitoxin system prevent-host-death family antitoxin [Oryzibacter oryziterrae]